jgi:hypothetical protein
MYLEGPAKKNSKMSSKMDLQVLEDIECKITHGALIRRGINHWVWPCTSVLRTSARVHAANNMLLCYGMGAKGGHTEHALIGEGEVGGEMDQTML